MSSTTRTKVIATAQHNLSLAAADIARRASAVGDQACAVGDAANAAVDDSLRATRRAFALANHRMQDIAFLKDDVAYRVKRAPLLSVGLAFGAGILAGIVTSVVSLQSRRSSWHDTLS